MSVAGPNDAVSANSIARQNGCDRWELFGQVSDMNVQGTGIAGLDGVHRFLAFSHGIGLGSRILSALAKYGQDSTLSGIARVFRKRGKSIRQKPATLCSATRCDLRFRCLRLMHQLDLERIAVRIARRRTSSSGCNSGRRTVQFFSGSAMMLPLISICPSATSII